MGNASNSGSRLHVFSVYKVDPAFLNEKAAIYQQIITGKSVVSPGINEKVLLIYRASDFTNQSFLDAINNSTPGINYRLYATVFENETKWTKESLINLYPAAKNEIHRLFLAQDLGTWNMFNKRLTDISSTPHS